MMRVLVRIFAVFGLLVVLLIGGAIAVGIALAPGKPDLPETIVLEFDLERSLAEAEVNDPFAKLVGGSDTSVRAVVDAMDRAARDPRVKGLVAKVGNSTMGVGVSQELRDAVARFRAAGKFALVHSETFGEFSNGTQSYYLAAAFDEVWMQPLGNLGATGFMATPMFYRGTLDKLNVNPQIGKRYEYKSAAEPYMEKSMTPANREMVDSFVGDLFEQVAAGIAADRKLPVEEVKAAIDRAPLLDKEAVDAKLIDRLGYYDEIMEAAKERARDGDKKAETVGLLTYGGAAGPANDQGPVIAVVVGEGAISRGESDTDPLSGSRSFGGADVAAALRKAIDDPQVKAIVFRVDSPGGSAVGSEVVRREVIRARKAGKPVIVSMSDLAASGGYWVSMAADKIVAQPATLTGSIGVLGGKLNITGAQNMIGLSIDTLSKGANAGMWSPQTDYTPAELARRDAMLDDIYGFFTRAVAEGRGMPVEKVHEIAKGRVWTGRQAKELGLVDALGGYATALDLAREAIGLAAGAPVTVTLYPKPKSTVEQFMEMFGDGDGGSAGFATTGLGRALLADALADYRPLLAEVAPLLKAAARPEEMTVWLPPMGVAGY